MYSTTTPDNIKISQVPVNITTDIPFVPRPFSGVSEQMGGTSYKSINSLESNHLYNKYQISSPHPQNTLTPCSIHAEYDSDTPRECYNTYSELQNTVGRVCTSNGTDGPLYTDCKDIDGNADWIRGNQFSAPYVNLNKKIKYYYNVPVLKEKQRVYVKYDEFNRVKYYNVPFLKEEQKVYVKYEDDFYPNRVLMNDKDYPHTNNNTESGFPTWKYPLTDSSDIVENFTISNNTVYLLIGISTIITGILYFSKKI